MTITWMLSVYILLVHTTYQRCGQTVLILSTVDSLHNLLWMGQGNLAWHLWCLLRYLFVRHWLNRDVTDDTYRTEVRYWCVNGSQFDVPGGPNITVDIKWEYCLVKYKFRGIIIYQLFMEQSVGPFPPPPSLRNNSLCWPAWPAPTVQSCRGYNRMDWSRSDQGLYLHRWQYITIFFFTQ